MAALTGGLVAVSASPSCTWLIVQGRQAGDGARRDAAARVALHAVVQTDGRRLRRTVVAGKLDDFVGAQTAKARDALRRIFGEAPFELLEANGMALHVIA